MYNVIDLERRISKQERDLLDSQLARETAENTISELQSKYSELLERNAAEKEEREKAAKAEKQLKELLNTVEQLKKENKGLKDKLSASTSVATERSISLEPSLSLPTSIAGGLSSVPSSPSSSNPPGSPTLVTNRDEKIKAIEGQRDALREALRSQRERKDGEIKSLNERIRQLEQRLEKERLNNVHMQQKIVGGSSGVNTGSTSSLSINANNTRSASSPTNGGSLIVSGNNGNGSASNSGHGNSGSGGSGSHFPLPSPSSEGFFSLTPPKRRVIRTNSFYNLSFGSSSGSNLLDAASYSSGTNTPSSIGLHGINGTGSTSAGTVTGMGSTSNFHASGTTSSSVGFSRSSSPVPLTLASGIMGSAPVSLDSLSSSSGSRIGSMSLSSTGGGTSMAPWADSFRFQTHSPASSLGPVLGNNHNNNIENTNNNNNHDNNGSNGNASSNLGS